MDGSLTFCHVASLPQATAEVGQKRAAEVPLAYSTEQPAAYDYSHYDPSKRARR